MNQTQAKPVDFLIRLLLVALLIVGSFIILGPFLIPLVWAVIIAVALWPTYVKVTERLGNKKKLSATLFTLLGVMILLLPSVLLFESSVIGYEKLSTSFESGDLTIPAPTE